MQHSLRWWQFHRHRRLDQSRDQSRSKSADDTSSGWLEAVPEAWHRFPSRALSLLTFCDPVAEAKADLEATMEATAAARASANGNDSSGGGMPASAAAERRLAEQRVAAHCDADRGSVC